MRMLAITLATLSATTAFAAEPPLPKMTGMVGDFIVFKTSKTISGQTSEQNLRVTLTALIKDKAAISTRMIIPGIDSANLPEIPILEIPAGVGLNPAELPDNVYMKLEQKPTKTTSGKEKLTVNGKKLDCEWVEQTVKVGVGPTAYDVVTKYWLCKDVPVTGLVKAEVSQRLPGLGDVKTVYELVEYGSK